MLTPITTPPTSISPEEHSQLTSSTPASFADIPPILRWTDDVQVALNPASGGWEGWSGGKVDGKLYVTEEAVSFIPNASTTPGFRLPFPSLTLHALTPASAGEPAHLYCQVDEGDAPVNGAQESVNGNGNGNGVDAEDEAEDEGEGEGGEEDYTALREVRIYVADGKLEVLFQALSQCSALHASLLPNGEPSSFFGFPTDEDEDEEDDGQWEDAEEQEQDGNGDGGRVRVIHFAPSTSTKTTTSIDKEFLIQSEVTNKDEDTAVNGEGQVVDQMERFLNLVDWGDVPKPKGWDQ